MSENSSRGIVLQHLKYGDSSLIVKVFTENHGLLSFIIKGAYTKHSRFKPAFFQPLTLIEFIARIKPGRDLHFMTEIAVETSYQTLHSGLQKNALVIFLSELLSKTINEMNPNRPLFGFVHQSLQWLDLQQLNYANFHLFFMIELSRYLGFYPKSDNYKKGQVFDLMDGMFKNPVPAPVHSINAELSVFFDQLCHISLEQLQSLHPGREARRQLLENLIVYYRLHLPGFKGMQSHEVLAVVLG